MTEAIYLEVTEKAEAARKAKRRVSVSVLPQLSVFVFHLYIRYGILNTIGDNK